MICVWVCAHERRCPQRTGIAYVLELVLEAAESHLTWGLGPALGTSNMSF